jgi:WD40 repeat protein
MRRLEGHTLDVMAVAFAPSGKELASAGWDGTIRVWDLAIGRCRRCIRTGNDHVLDIAFSPDGQFLAAGFRYGRVVDVQYRDYQNTAWFPVEPSGQSPPDWILPEVTWHTPGSATKSVSFTVDGKSLLTCGQDGRLLLWDLARRTTKWVIPHAQLTKGRLRPDGAAVAGVSSQVGEGVIVWHRGSRGTFSSKPRILQLPNDACSSVAWAPNGQSLAAAFESGKIAWWEPDGESLPVIREGHRGAAGAVAFSPDGRLLLTAGKDGLIHMWDNSTHSRVTTFDWEVGDVHDVKFAPDGLTAAAAGFQTILLWDIDG